MNKTTIDPLGTLAGREYAEFLNNHGFILVMDENGDDFSCTVFQSEDILIAFTYQQDLGENLTVAEAGSPLNQTSIKKRQDGWSLIGEVWKDVYQNYHKARKEIPYPHALSREQEIALISDALNSFMTMIVNKEVSIGHPKYRMNI
ncbi:hypothetical protein HQ393_07490 [Chitinibacter bivalviorum]|uniref:Uncharacterized protein n=1 Tax=Chitinibacter bivalviorum TaxID=2739434 RepID=A0A7H9BJD1_9NEIS|nr:hypothetical protein [Chitinibacter bivalviorum]QLG88111.1 hypothetical protein HQ393_07490 [Chitinibacter bivalviorum]